MQEWSEVESCLSKRNQRRNKEEVPKEQKTGKRRLLMVIYWMRRWGRSSDTGGTAPEVAGTAQKRSHFEIKQNPWS